MLLLTTIIFMVPIVYASPCHITVIKKVVGVGPDEEFTIIMGYENATTEHLFLNNTEKIFQLTIGNHTVTETLPEGWTLEITIEDPSNDSYVQGDTAYIDLGDEGVTVTFINRYVPPPENGDILVGGEIVPNNLNLRPALAAMALVITAVIATKYNKMKKQLP